MQNIIKNEMNKFKENGLDKNEKIQKLVCWNEND